MAAAFGSLLLAPAAADAAYVSTYREPEEPEPPYEYGYDGARVEDRLGERNDLRVEVVEDRVGYRARINVRELGRPRLIAGRGCRQLAPRRVTCRTPGAFDETFEFGVLVGRGDDVVRCRGAHVDVIAGGDGDDRLSSGGCGSDMLGGKGNDRLRGDRFRQYIFGDAGRDRVAAGGGKDLIYGEGFRRGPAPDILDGGRGRDMVSWDDRKDGLRIDLGRGTGPEGDRLTGIENASGGRGDDVLIGDEEPNRLRGGNGHDRLVGRGGNDRLDGGSGSTQWADGPDDYRDSFGCGEGHDRVIHPNLALLPSSCEVMMDWSELDTSLDVRIFPREAGLMSIAVPSVCRMDVQSCRRRAVISSRGVELGRSEMRDASRRRVTWLTVPLTRALPDGAPVRIEIHGEDVDSDVMDEGHPYRYFFVWRIRCEGPPACRSR